MLFGKIQDSGVVDVANYTLVQDELKYMTGSGRSDAAVIKADKKNDLRRPRRMNGRVAKRPPLDSNPRQGFANIRTSQCARNREPTLEKYLGNQAVSAAGMFAPYRHLLGFN